MSWIPTKMSQHTQVPPHPIGQYLSLERTQALGLLTPAFSQFKVSNTSLWCLNPNLGQDPGAILNFQIGSGFILSDSSLASQYGISCFFKYLPQNLHWICKKPRDEAYIPNGASPKARASLTIATLLGLHISSRALQELCDKPERWCCNSRILHSELWGFGASTADPHDGPMEPAISRIYYGQKYSPEAH